MKTGVLCAAALVFGMNEAAWADLRPAMRPADLGVAAVAPAMDLRPLIRTAVSVPVAIAAPQPSFAPSLSLIPLTRPNSVTARAADAATPVPGLPVDPIMLTAVARLVETPGSGQPAAVALPSGAIVTVNRANTGWKPAVLPPQTIADTLADQPVLSVSTSGAMLPPTLRPRVRPAGVEIAVANAPAVGQPLSRAFRPEPRPKLQRAAKPVAEAEIIPAAVVRVQPGKAVVIGKKGSVCGDPSIRGQTIAPIIGRIKGCGVPDAVMVTSVAGVKLSEAATIDCNTARALDAWVEQGLQPQFASDPVVQLRVAGHYVCRSRNNIPGGKISEHGKGKAIDISGFVLSSGAVLNISDDWRTKANGRLIKAAHKAACGVFNTTLGPGSDGYHEDHLHFDTANGRGPYCR